MPASKCDQRARASLRREAGHGARDVLVLGEASDARAATGQRSASNRTAVETARTWRAVLRRDLFGELWLGTDPARAAAVLRARGVYAAAPHDGGDLGGGRPCRALVPRGRVGLYPRRRLIRGGEGELRTSCGPGRGGGVDGRLRGHGRGPDCRR